MSTRVDFTPGGFMYLSGGAFPFSSGIAAAESYVLTRVRFRTPQPLAEGLAIAANFLETQNRPLGSLAACELRSPAPFPGMQQFVEFNHEYRELLRANGFGADDAFPIARSNLAPLFDPPATTTLFAFTYTLRADFGSGAASRDFVISGMPELSGDPPAVVAPGDTSAAGLAQKAATVVAALRRRVAELDAHWSRLTATQIYSVHSFDAVREVLCANGLPGSGITVFPAYPPITGLDFEADVRAVSLERVL